MDSKGELNVKLIIAAIFTVVILFTTHLEAHTVLKSSSPASGSIVEESPQQVTLVFGEPTRVTSIAVVTAEGERRLEFTPAGSATTFIVQAPNLGNGRNELLWRALSADGHPVSGSVIIVVRTSADQ